LLQAKLDYFRRHLPRITPFVAVKTNPDETLAALFGDQGVSVGFDVASEAEIELAINAIDTTNSNVIVSRLIYANPQKNPTSIQHALELNVKMMTFDTLEEGEERRRKPR